MNSIEWFRQFCQTCDERTIAALMFLYEWRSSELLDKEDSREFINEQLARYKSIIVDENGNGHIKRV